MRNTDLYKMVSEMFEEKGVTFIDVVEKEFFIERYAKRYNIPLNANDRYTINSYADDLEEDVDELNGEIKEIVDTIDDVRDKIYTLKNTIDELRKLK